MQIKELEPQFQTASELKWHKANSNDKANLHMGIRNNYDKYFYDEYLKLNFFMLYKFEFLSSTDYLNNWSGSQSGSMQQSPADVKGEIEETWSIWTNKWNERRHWYWIS